MKANLACRKLSVILEELKTRVRVMVRETLCPVCLERRRDVALACGHTFCAACWNYVRNNDNVVTRCPICRAVHSEALRIYL